jgi:hypothetical protein
MVRAKSSDPASRILFILLILSSFSPLSDRRADAVIGCRNTRPKLRAKRKAFFDRMVES